MSPTFTKDRLLRNAPDTIFTYSGGTIRPLDPDPDDIVLEDIAHALSNQCRWTGHTRKFYSVAEHCVLCSRITPTLEALLHDASEAYLADLARPIKHAPDLGEVYLKYERQLEEAIAVKFGLVPPPMSPEVKKADDTMLLREAQKLVPVLGDLYPDPPKGTPNVHCWTPTEAKIQFMFRYEELGGTV